jgi:outer membrane lipoprotein carrier protein
MASVPLMLPQVVTKPLTFLLIAVLWAPATFALPMEQVLKNVSSLQKRTSTLEADFRQVRTMKLLAEPSVSRGTFAWRKPNSAVWNYNQPEPVTMLIADGWMTTYYPRENRAERAAIGRLESRIFRFMGAVTSVEEMARSFDMRFVDRAGEPYRLELKPKMPGAGRHVKNITLWIDRAAFTINAFEYTERDGDVTRYEFTNIRLNPPLAASRFRLDLPAGARVEQMKLD